MIERDAYKDLQRKLLFEPSPDFATKVRKRIREAPSPVRNWFSWRPAMMAAAAGLVALVGVSVWQRRSETVIPPAPTLPVVAQLAPRADSVPVMPVTAARIDVTRPAATHMTRTARAIDTALHSAPAAPGILIAPDQAMALQGFLASLRAVPSTHAAVVAAPVETDPLLEGKENADPTISAIVILPIKIELLTPVARGGGHF